MCEHKAAPHESCQALTAFLRKNKGSAGSLRRAHCWHFLEPLQWPCSAWPSVLDKEVLSWARVPKTTAKALFLENSDHDTACHTREKELSSYHSQVSKAHFSFLSTEQNLLSQFFMGSWSRTRLHIPVTWKTAKYPLTRHQALGEKVMMTNHTENNFPNLRMGTWGAGGGAEETECLPVDTKPG
jgi:hypothetical protein